MAVARIEIKIIYILDVFYLAKQLIAERRLALECVQDDTLDQISKCHVQILGRRFEHLQDPFLDTHTGLNSFHLNLVLHVPLQYLCI